MNRGRDTNWTSEENCHKWENNIVFPDTQTWNICSLSGSTVSHCHFLNKSVKKGCFFMVHPCLNTDCSQSYLLTSTSWQTSYSRFQGGKNTLSTISTLLRPDYSKVWSLASVSLLWYSVTLIQVSKRSKLPTMLFLSSCYSKCPLQESYQPWYSQKRQTRGETSLE